MSLKIIGGLYKNRVLKAPVGSLVKPTLAIVRKSVFDMCQNIIEEAYVLDLFACSGAIGIEALSRGALNVTFIEQDFRSIASIRANLELLNIKEQAKVIKGDVFLEAAKLEAMYDMIYLDPPYPIIKKDPHLITQLLLTLEPLCKKMLFFEEGTPGMDLPNLDSFTKKTTRKFADTLIHQWKK